MFVKESELINRYFIHLVFSHKRLQNLFQLSYHQQGCNLFTRPVYEWLLWVIAVLLAREMKYNIIKQRYAEWGVNLSIFLMFIGFIFLECLFYFMGPHIKISPIWKDLISFILVLMFLNINFCKLVNNQLRKPVVGTILIPLREVCHNERDNKSEHSIFA